MPRWWPANSKRRTQPSRTVRKEPRPPPALPRRPRCVSRARPKPPPPCLPPPLPNPPVPAPDPPQRNLHAKTLSPRSSACKAAAGRKRTATVASRGLIVAAVTVMSRCQPSEAPQVSRTSQCVAMSPPVGLQIQVFGGRKKKGTLGLMLVLMLSTFW